MAGQSASLHIVYRCQHDQEREDMVDGPRHADDRHWVVVETGANQAFIFASNKQAVNVGASQLIWQVGHTWVDDAVSDLRGDVGGHRIEPIVKASGKALLLVDSPDTGRAFIRAITRRALREAPGLDVWGVVDPTPVGDAGVGPSLARAHRLQAAWRGRRPSSQLRFPTVPFVQPCHYSGLPATDIENTDDRHGRAAIIASAWAARDAGRTRMAGLLGTRNVVRPDHLNDGISHAGWVAVMHADGNGIGDVFRNLDKFYAGDEFLERLRSFSEALDRVTEAALGAAVEGYPDYEDWLLPLVVGGDDVTVMMDARIAFDVTVSFIEEFARRTAEDEVIAGVVERMQADDNAVRRRGLTACAGIAYVKPHYAFSESYQLAEELCASAKRVKEAAPGCGALDFQVLHDTFGRDLNQVRENLVVLMPDSTELRLWPGPVVVGGEMPLTDWAVAHDVAQLDAARRALRANPGCEPDSDPAGVLNRSALHQIRQALLRGGQEIERASVQVASWAPRPTDARSYLDSHMCVPEPVLTDSDEPSAFSRILAAVDLLDMSAGTAPHMARELEEVR